MALWNPPILSVKYVCSFESIKKMNKKGKDKKKVKIKEKESYLIKLNTKLFLFLYFEIFI